MTWDREDKERTALHEAGHAVVAWSFGVTVAGIHLDLEHESGHADIASASHLEPVEQIAKWLAGFEAEQAFKPPGRKAKAMFDYGEVCRILRENETPEETPEGRELREGGRACAAARLREHEAKARGVALHLIEHHYIDRVGFEEMMREPAEDFEEWLEANIKQWIDDGWDPFDGQEFDDEDPGPPLTPADLSNARAELAEWASPPEFRRRVRCLHKRSRSKEIFNDPKRKFLLDAWVLAQLSKHKEFRQIRLADVDEQWPDGYAQNEAGEQKIEVTSALFPGRRLGAEYRFEGRMEHDSVENWIERAESIPAALEKAVSDKVPKRYGSPFALVVYVNISEYGIRQAETEQDIANIKSKYGASFQHLWVLWKDKVF